MAKNTNLAEARARMYRDLVFRAAEKVFAARGFAGAAMQEIAAEAGISLKTLYATFRGKDEIYRAISEQRRGEFLTSVAGSVSPEGGALDRLAEGVRAYVDFLLAHRDYLSIQLREGRGWGLDPADESRGVWQSGLELQAALIRAGIAEGVFHGGDPELMAASAIAIMQVQLAGLVARSKAPDGAAISAEIVRELERYLRRSSWPPPALRATSRREVQAGASGSRATAPHSLRRSPRRATR